MTKLCRFFRRTALVVALIFSFQSHAGEAVGFQPYGLSHETDVFHTGVGPSFSWKTRSEENGWKQGAYQVVVSGSAGVDPVWDSGKVESDRQLFVPGPEETFAFDRTYSWKVRVWDRSGQASPWSEPSTFRMPRDPDEPWPGQWITYDYTGAEPMPYFRRTFTLEHDAPVESARLHISGLGYYEAFLNGRRIGDQVLDPAQTNYDDYAFYSVFDLPPGDLARTNTLGLMLGDGWFNQKLVWNPPSMSYGQPVLNAFLRIRYADGHEQVVATDTDWKWHPGPVVEANIYKGETYDARRELPEEAWFALLLPKAKRGEEVLKMEFRRFLHCLICFGSASIGKNGLRS
jgi:alpha-L-rhamnosidase